MSLHPKHIVIPVISLNYHIKCIDNILRCDYLALFICFMKQHFALQKKQKITSSLNKKPLKANWFILYVKALRESDRDNNNIPMLTSNYIEKKARLSLRNVLSDANRHNIVPFFYLEAFCSKLIQHKSKQDEKAVYANDNSLLPTMKINKPVKVLITADKSEEKNQKEDEAIIKKVKRLKVKSMNDAKLLLSRSSLSKQYSNIKSRFREKRGNCIFDSTTFNRNRLIDSAFSYESLLNKVESRAISPLMLSSIRSSLPPEPLIASSPPLQIRNHSLIAHKQHSLKPKVFNRNDFYF